MLERTDQRERSVLFVEPFHSGVIEMRELQLNDIAIPCLGILNFFVVRQGREGGPPMYAEAPVFQGFPNTARSVADAFERT